MRYTHLGLYHVRRMSSRTRSSYTSGWRRIASVTPAEFVSATAFTWPMDCLWSAKGARVAHQTIGEEEGPAQLCASYRVNSVMGKTMGTGIDTRIDSGGKVACIQSVGALA